MRVGLTVLRRGTVGPRPILDLLGEDQGDGSSGESCPRRRVFDPKALRSRRSPQPKRPRENGGVGPSGAPSPN